MLASSTIGGVGFGALAMVGMLMMAAVVWLSGA
jgi:hypothetical protein